MHADTLITLSRSLAVVINLARTISGRNKVPLLSNSSRRRPCAAGRQVITLIRSFCQWGATCSTLNQGEMPTLNRFWGIQWLACAFTQLVGCIATHLCTIPCILGSSEGGSVKNLYRVASMTLMCHFGYALKVVVVFEGEPSAQSEVPAAKKHLCQYYAALLPWRNAENGGQKVQSWLHWTKECCFSHCESFRCF